MKNLIFDFETVGQNTCTCPVLIMEAITFDDDRFVNDPYTASELIEMSTTFKVSMDDQLKNYGYKPEQSALDFWMSQPKNLQKKMLPSPDDLTVKDFCGKFIKYLDDTGPHKYWWSRSNTFDPPILNRLAFDSGYHNELGKRLKYWAVRDTRTFIDALTGFQLKDNGFVPMKNKEDWDKVFVKHDPKCDLMADVLRMQMLVRNEF